MSGPAPARVFDPVTVRESQDSDVAAIQRIYSHHVLTGLGSFEETPPSPDEIARRRREILSHGLPYLVAESGGHILGYAYAGLFRPRSAYRYSVEDSIYVAPDAQRRGIGRRMLDELIERCTKLGYRQMVAVIGDSANHGSIGVHKAAGFADVARLPAVGFKFRRWVDIVMMQRALGPGQSTLPER
ncbi:MAG TPA: GNAT family N-acetyltransferase [Alphaproteobacteria bacterium]|nr:GNAT family N-acetyltransferase [Alphaproteobacteria bacterium]